MSIVVRLIHERHSMGPTPSCLIISVLHISRSWKYVITMNLKCSNKWNIDLERLFYKYFCKFPHFLGSKCWILSYHKSYNTDIKQRNRPKSSAKALLEKNLKTKHRGDPYLTFMNISFNKCNSFFYHMGLNGNICHDLHRGLTISKEFTIWKIGETGFWIVEEHVVDCFEIGSHKTRWLWKEHGFLVKSNIGSKHGSTHWEHSFELNCWSVLVEPTSLHHIIILFGRKR